MLESGERVFDTLTGQYGTVHIGRMAGAFTVEWDENPGVLEYAGEWELVPAREDAGE